MTFRVRSIPKTFGSLYDFGIKNLIVGGCSFTYNNSDQHICSWPYYLRDMGSFDTVLDCSLPGAGNSHIASSLQWSLAAQQPDPDNSLVIVMWSGNDRDDFLCNSTKLNGYPMRYDFSDQVSSAISGGSHPNNRGNIVNATWEVKEFKSPQSRAIENFLYVLSLHAWLTVNGYRFVFLHWLDRNLPSRAEDFDIEPLLPRQLAQQYKKMFSPIEDIYSWSLKHNYLDSDDFHPSVDGHLSWTKSVLIPFLKQVYSSDHTSLICKKVSHNE